MPETSFTQIVAQTVLLGLAALLVLYGLKIWKFYVSLVSAFVGFALAAMIVSVFAAPSVAVVLVGAAGALVGATVAWPLQKAVVFIAAGGALAAVGMALMQTVYPPLAVWVVGAVLLVVGGWLSLKAFEQLLVVSMAAASAGLTMHALGSACPMQGFGSGVAGAQAIVAMLDPLFVVLAVFNIVLAYFCQIQVRNTEKTDSIVDKRKIVFQRISLVISILMILDWVIVTKINVKPITMFSPILWPLPAFMLSSLAVYGLKSIEATWLRWLLAAVTSISLHGFICFASTLLWAVTLSIDSMNYIFEIYAWSKALDLYSHIEITSQFWWGLVINLLLIPGVVVIVLRQTQSESVARSK